MRRCREWPGLSCLPLLLEGRPRAFRWFNWTRRASGNARRSARALLDDRWAEPELLRLTPLPNARFRKPGALRRFLLRAVKAIEGKALREHPSVLGRSGVLSQQPHATPGPSERKRRPLCHTSIPELLAQFRHRYRSFAEAFRRASIRWRNGDSNAVFPEPAIKPFVWAGFSALPVAA